MTPFKFARLFRLQTAASAAAMSLALTSLMAPIAHAQDQADDEEAGRFLDTITVEARRTKENLQDVPVSITAISEEALLDFGLKDLVSLQGLIPGLTAAEGVNDSTARFFIRGAGTAVPGPGTETAVPIYIDDVYIPSGLASKFDIFALDRVEVLRGPQGTLYGRNSFGGAINVYTKGFTNETEGSVSATIGSENRRDLKAEIRTPIIEDMLWVGGGVAFTKRDGFQDLVVLGKEGWADDSQLYRFKVQFEPTDELRFTFSAEQTEKDAPSKQPKSIAGTGTLTTADLVGPTLIGFDAEGLVPSRLLTDTDPDRIEANGAGNEVVDLTGYSLKVEYDFTDNLSFRYVGGYRDLQNIRVFDIDTGPTAIIQLAEDFRTDTTSHDFQLSYENGRLRGLVGGFFYDENATGTNFSSAGFFNGFAAPAGSANPASPIADPEGRLTSLTAGAFSNVIDNKVEAQAVFGNVSFDITDQLTITGGLRFTNEDRSADTPIDGITFVFEPGTIPVNGDIVPSFFGVPPGATVVADSDGVFGGGEASFSDTTGELTLEYRPYDDKLVYASFKQGFRAGVINSIIGGIDASTGFAPPADAENVDAYEVGFKTTWANGRVLLNGAAFYNDFTDLQLPVTSNVPMEVSPTGVATFIQNAGAANSKGFELEGGIYLTDNFLINGNMAYLDFELEELINLVNGVPTNIAEDFTGQELSPEFSGFIGAEYTMNVMDDDKLLLFANASYQGEKGVGPGLRAGGLVDEERADAFTNVAAGLVLTVDETWELRVSGNNLLDERRPVNVIPAPPAFGFLTWFNEPRTWTASITYNF